MVTKQQQRKYRRDREQRLQDAELCVRCRAPMPPDSKTARCPKCLEYLRCKNAEHYARRKLEHRCNQCGKPMAAEYKHVVCEPCDKKRDGPRRKERARLKAETIQAYGSKCACCGETELWFLTLDHINNDGKAHRQLAGMGTAFYRKLRSQGFPNDPPLQVLCWNCNLAKHQRGVCPHQVP